MEKEIIWTKTALNQLQEIYFYLLETSKSESIASRVTDTLFDSTEILKHSWEIYERDEMKIPKSDEYRAYEIFSYRISYKIEDLSIIILRVRHTSRNLKPL